MNKGISVALAAWLLKEMPNVPAEGQRIAVKVHPTYIGDDAHKHHARCVLVGVEGRKLIVRPLGGKDQYVEPEGCQFWHSHLHPKVLEMIAQFQKTELSNKRTIRVMTPPPPQHNKPVYQKPVLAMKNAEIITSEPKVKAFAPIPKVEPIPTPEPKVVEVQPEPVKEIKMEPTVAPPPVQLPTTVPTSYQEQLILFNQLKAQLEEKAKTDGLETLKRLHRDRADALAMVEQTEMEIVTVIKQLAQFNVEIPKELLPSSTPMKTTSVAPIDTYEPETQNGDGEFVSGSMVTKQSNWTPGKAQRHKENILTFLRMRKNLPAKGPDIMDYIKEGRHNATSILYPLVADEVLEKTGDGVNIRYRIKGFGNGPLIEDDE